MNAAAIRKRLGEWYAQNRRDLPWRRTRDPYRIWISEIMLQQTRVAAAIPYYERFLARFPDVQTLAAAPEEDVLKLWGGLGYYSRARNLHKAAQEIVVRGSFPTKHEEIVGLPGIGPYTAAAVSSIAFGLPHAVVDGNVKRVVARLMNSDAADVGGVSAQLLDPKDPGASNQALMELGAVICVPKGPRCGECPLAGVCAAKRNGTQDEVPRKKVRKVPQRIHRVFLVIRKQGRILLRQGIEVKGFWDLPEPHGELHSIRVGAKLGQFRHSILDRLYTCDVHEAMLGSVPEDFRWWPVSLLDEIPLSTAAKKALRCLNE